MCSASDASPRSLAILPSAGERRRLQVHPGRRGRLTWRASVDRVCGQKHRLFQSREEILVLLRVFNGAQVILSVDPDQ